MFSYYGSKSKIVDYYPPPKHGKIIEPFAGSARYSLKYWQNDILLVDKYVKLIELWQWLQNQTPKDIIGLPNMSKGDDLRLMDLPKEAKYLIGFNINQGSRRPVNIASGFNGWNKDKTRIANELHKIKHWEIKLGSYHEIENIKATWFIDPPYQFGGELYKESGKNIDYSALSKWCRERNGQTIVCENTKADWMPFKAMINNSNMYNRLNTTEAIWSNYKTNYDNEQLGLWNTP